MNLARTTVQKAREFFLWKQLRLWGSFVRFSHSIFALPFALSMFVFVSGHHSVTSWQLLAITVAVVSARTAAMSFNRLVDASIDKRNPRTANRELPTGDISLLSAVALLLVSCLIFLLSAASLGSHCLIMAPAVLIVLLGYSYTKRFTSLSHFILGLALACAPGGVWYAITGVFSWIPLWMMLGVLFWVAGFDILYALQDRDFDMQQKLFSIPVRMGKRGALKIAVITHIVSLLFFVIFGLVSELTIPYWIGLTIFAAMLLSQNIVICQAPAALIENTFFTRNAWASVIYFVAMVGAVYW